MKGFEEVSQVRLIDISGRKIPSVSIGTSPFIGASQFGLKAVTYYKRFYLQPQNITKIIVKAIDLGIPSVQLLLDKVIIDAVSQAEKERDVRLAKLVTIGISRVEEEFKLLEDLEPEVAFIHGEISDTLNIKVLEDLIKQIKKRDVIPGFATHKPSKTLEWLERSGLTFDVYLAPVNKLGKFMGKDSSHVLELIKKTKKIVIAKKVLAAGEIRPDEALSYIKGIENIKGITVGITSSEEAEETLCLAKELFNQ